jgi:hypothetical protein
VKCLVKVTRIALRVQNRVIASCIIVLEDKGCLCFKHDQHDPFTIFVHLSTMLYIYQVCIHVKLSSVQQAARDGMTELNQA